MNNGATASDVYLASGVILGALTNNEVCEQMERDGVNAVAQVFLREALLLLERKLREARPCIFKEVLKGSGGKSAERDVSRIADLSIDEILLIKWATEDAAKMGLYTKYDLINIIEKLDLIVEELLSKG